MKMEQTECSETSAYKFQMLGNHPKESIQHAVHGKSLKSRCFTFPDTCSELVECFWHYYSCVFFVILLIGMMTSRKFHQFRTHVKESKTQQPPRPDITDLDLNSHLEELIHNSLYAWLVHKINYVRWFNKNKWTVIYSLVAVTQVTCNLHCISTGNLE